MAKTAAQKAAAAAKRKAANEAAHDPDPAQAFHDDLNKEAAEAAESAAPVASSAEVEQTLAEAAAEKAEANLEKAKKGNDGEPTDPAHLKRLKLQADAAKRKAIAGVVEEYYGLVGGRKLVLCRRKKNGNVHRFYLGNSKNKQIAEKIKALSNAGKLKVL